MNPVPEQQSSLAIPLAIVIGFALIALAIFFTNNDSEGTTTVSLPIESEETVTTGEPRPVDESDYIRGNPNAPILLIEYSDYDCPFCKQFHSTMNRVIDEFGVGGRVAWVYRQYPLQQLHPNAPRISEAALCVGDIGGNLAFWQFSDLVFEQRETNEPTNMVLLPEYAELAGVDREAYNDCMGSGRMRQAVIDSVEDGLSAGIRGTPHTYIVAGDQQAVVNGARSYETVSGIVRNLLDQLDGNFDPSTAELPTEVNPNTTGATE